jgi:hypothetical protein
MLMYFFAGFFFDSHSVYYDQTLGSGAVFVFTLWITLLCFVVAWVLMKFQLFGLGDIT